MLDGRSVAEEVQRSMAKSVAKNAVYNGVRTICNMLFPLITYPYATRVLMAENLGKVDFGASIISYFVLIAGLGISTYATREGAGYREDKDSLNGFASQVFTINIMSTIISYLLLLGLILIWPKLQGYLLLIAIQSFSIIGATIGVEWVYSIQEDYGYITARSIIVQVISTILLFLLVKRPEDYIIYAAITVFANVGANLFNFILARKYVRIKLTWGFDYMRHLIPMFILFGNAVAVTIYVNIDVTLLSTFKTDYDVGIYSVAVKVYTIVKSLLNSVTMVALPRLSLYRTTGQHREYQNLQDAISHALVVGVLPVMTMFFLMADYVVLIVGGEGFIASASPLRILCFAAIPAVFACYVTSAILLPNKGERLNLRATVAGAIVNFTSNLAIIPLFGIEGAAFTTFLAELVVLLYSSYLARSFCDWHHVFAVLAKPVITALLCVATMTAAHLVSRAVLTLDIVGFFATGFMLAFVAAVTLLICRDELVLGFIRTVLKRR